MSGTNAIYVPQDTNCLTQEEKDMPELLRIKSSEGTLPISSRYGSVRWALCSSESHSRSCSSDGSGLGEVLFPRLLSSFLTRGFYCKHLSLEGDSPADEFPKLDTSSHAPLSLPLDRKSPTHRLLKALRHPKNPKAQWLADHLPSQSFSFLHSPFDLTIQQVKSMVSPKYWCFFSTTFPSHTFDDYVSLLYQCSTIGAEIFILAIGVLWRVSRRVPVCSRSIHRIFLAALVLCQKVRIEENFTLHQYATLGGVEVHELAAMEWAMLELINFDLFGGQMKALYIDLVYSLRVHCQIETAFKVEWMGLAWSEATLVLPMPDHKTR